MPPTSELISTCLSCPFASFFTFTLHPGSIPNATTIAAMRTAETLFMRILRPSPCNLHGALQTGAPLCDVWYAHREMAADGDLSKQRLDRAYLRDRRVGERTN